MMPAKEFARIEHLMVGVRTSPGEIVAQIQAEFPTIRASDVFRHDPHILAGRHGNAHRRARDAVLDGIYHEHELYLSALEHMLQSGSWQAATNMAKLVVKSRELLARAHGVISQERGPAVQILNAPIGAGAGGSDAAEGLIAEVRRELERRKLAQVEARGETPVLIECAEAE